jgi:hypothetical protein
MNNITVHIDGKDFIIDIAKAKSLGLLKADTTIKDFRVGDVFMTSHSSAVIIVKCGYASRGEQKYSIAGLSGGLDIFSDFGEKGATKEEVLKFLNRPHAGIEFIKNINADFSLLLSRVIDQHVAESLISSEDNGDCEYNG